MRKRSDIIGDLPTRKDDFWGYVANPTEEQKQLQLFMEVLVDIRDSMVALNKKVDRLSKRLEALYEEEG